MIVCSCCVLSDSEIRSVFENGGNLQSVFAKCKHIKKCTNCLSEISCIRNSVFEKDLLAMKKEP